MIELLHICQLLQLLEGKHPSALSIAGQKTGEVTFWWLVHFGSVFGTSEFIFNNGSNVLRTRISCDFFQILWVRPRNFLDIMEVHLSHMDLGFFFSSIYVLLLPF